jgi:hypothetical protein
MLESSRSLLSWIESVVADGILVHVETEPRENCAGPHVLSALDEFWQIGAPPCKECHLKVCIKVELLLDWHYERFGKVFPVDDEPPPKPSIDVYFDELSQIVCWNMHSESYEPVSRDG